MAKIGFFDRILRNRLTAARAGYLDNLNNAGLLKVNKFHYKYYEVTPSQATPVQNTWYDLLDTVEDCRIYILAVKVADTDETLELKITIDGVVIDTTLAATANTIYYVHQTKEAVTCWFTSTVQPLSFVYEGQSLKIEIRKTTATGTGTFSAVIKYGLMEAT